jgi:hypothetical protein
MCCVFVCCSRFFTELGGDAELKEMCVKSQRFHSVLKFDLQLVGLLLFTGEPLPLLRSFLPAARCDRSFCCCRFTLSAFSLHPSAFSAISLKPCERNAGMFYSEEDSFTGGIVVVCVATVLEREPCQLCHSPAIEAA